MLMTKFPCCNSNRRQWNLNQRVVVIPPSSCKKVSGWGVRTHPPMILLAMALEIKLFAFSGIASLPSSLCEGPFFIVSEALPPSLMAGRLFGLS